MDMTELISQEPAKKTICYYFYVTLKFYLESFTSICWPISCSSVDVISSDQNIRNTLQITIFNNGMPVS